MKVVTKIYNLFCKADLKGDDDGISKPMSQMKDVHADNITDAPNNFLSPKPHKKNSKAKSPTQGSLTNVDERLTSPSSHGPDSKKNLSGMESFHHDEEAGSKKMKIWEHKEDHHEEEIADDLVYGKTLLNKPIISKSDILEVFS